MQQGYKWTNPRTQTAIVSDKAAGLTVRQIAAKYDVSLNTVSRVVRRFKDAEPRTELANGVAEGYRERLKSKAIVAIESGLDYDADPYKRAHLGVKVLEGTGEFVSGQHLQVDGAVAMQVSWMPVQAPEYPISDQPIDAESKLIKD